MPVQVVFGNQLCAHLLSSSPEPQSGMNSSFYSLATLYSVLVITTQPLPELNRTSFEDSLPETETKCRRRVATTRSPRRANVSTALSRYVHDVSTNELSRVVITLTSSSSSGLENASRLFAGPRFCPSKLKCTLFLHCTPVPSCPVPFRLPLRRFFRTSARSFDS